MRLSTILLAAVGITTSVAHVPTTLNNHDYDIDTNSNNPEDETDIDDDDGDNNRASNKKCSRSASSLLRSTPTPSPTDFRSWFSSTYLPTSASRPTTTITTGPNALGCAPTDIPPSLSSDFEDYRTRLSKSWYAKKSSGIRKLLSSCSTQTLTGMREVRTLAAMVTGECGLVSQTIGPNTALPTTRSTSTRSRTTTTTTSGGNGGSLPTSSTSTGGGGGLPRATGLGSLGSAVVVGAVAGVVGVVVF